MVFLIRPGGGAKVSIKEGKDLDGTLNNVFLFIMTECSNKLEPSNLICL